MSDARIVLGSLRPQAFGGRPDRISDPIVEPMWAGTRALAAVDEAGTLLADESGALIEDRPEIVNALQEAALTSGIVLDGFVTKQAVQDGTSASYRPEYTPSLGTSVGHFFFGSRRNRAAEAAQAREELRKLQAFGPDDTVAYVAIDLLWLDGELLLDIPLLERRRLLDGVLVESELVRRSPFVRAPITRWIRSWRAQGFVGITFRAANSRYEPGVASADWATAPMPR